ncbi:hypothetical protein RY831_27810 [Noviherbaspirillum sp. CPCC 100848]|uniref:Uncharacterized protein n=1 Tax=Noviherbaspirillum album TaxID=3080276 RepID=A0ABU6JHF5_9BURK|nr:hypothetical protein [Noviherbaspirillum sp. CPCC 100848]MEC4722970.1 hypothetical protein [Noviherbaspirillum sp. CPCC 100848]
MSTIKHRSDPCIIAVAIDSLGITGSSGDKACITCNFFNGNLLLPVPRGAGKLPSYNKALPQGDQEQASAKHALFCPFAAVRHRVLHGAFPHLVLACILLEDSMCASIANEQDTGCT